MILSCNNISKSFGTDVIIKSCSFNIEDHEKAAIVGINGAGKSTLLKIITGIEPADTGLVTLAKDKTLGYLSQQQNLNSDNTIYDELLSVKQYILDMEAQLRSIENQMKSAARKEAVGLILRLLLPLLLIREILHHFLFLTRKMEQAGERVISTDHKIEAGLYHIEQQKRNKGEGERDQPAAKEEVIQTQVVEEKVQRIAQRPAAGNGIQLLFRNRCVRMRHLKVFHG